MNKQTIRDIDVRGKKVLLRVDYNVTVDEKTGRITDDSRIRATLPTLRYLLERNAKIIICSHFGRPGGKVVESMRLKGVAARLSELIGKPVATISDCIGPEVEKAVASLKNGQLLLLENLRFHKEEEANDIAFARSLAKFGEIYVNDAFGASHRAHASIVGVAMYLPAVAGLLMEKELTNLGNILVSPARPFGELVGGAKVSDKVQMLLNIMPKIDVLLIGGGMLATFMKAQGLQVGSSMVENDLLDVANRIIADTGKLGVKLVLPSDLVVAPDIKSGAGAQIVALEKVPADLKIVDIGPASIDTFTAELKCCKTVFWNGPMGVNEVPQFANGTTSMAKLLAGLKATTVLGGGSTGDVVTNLGLADKMTFVSTGGGASLEFLSGEKLPGVEALMDRR